MRAASRENRQSAYAKTKTHSQADQPGGNSEADQSLFFCYMDSTIKLLAIFCDSTEQFVSDLFENHIVCLMDSSPTKKLQNRSLHA